MSGSLLLICELLSKVEVVKVSQLPQNICLKMIGWIKCESFTLDFIMSCSSFFYLKFAT